MPRTITVKGIGKVSAAPDFVVLSMGLESQDMDYEKAMNIASENIDLILLSSVQETAFPPVCTLEIKKEILYPIGGRIQENIEGKES